MPQPQFFENELGLTQIMWDWTSSPPRYDWGYPHQVGGNVYHKEYLLDIIGSIEFDNPTELEGQLNFPYEHRRLDSPYMLCFNESKVLTIPVNVTNDNNQNRNSDEYTLKGLNDKFLEGHRIKTDMYGIKSNAINKELMFQFEEKEYNG